ncbi:AAA family ATPase [Cellulomonas shaoxiangyii]|uniref:26S protease regulatory subunit n=1 Tax=Cellulomonas shaoxiangyii TaxID=2566013 RepID=A0A4P7SJC3_9CELL|nr:ATP-binding protein [Cellulomonas shaoxiangyii]QCB92613.1 26S protease regulatory subunit [Cellulomonas shaoxiangyii]TGY85231.1 26S protease regulatory subunit [Cellulomonas shaoxiangyii]
MAPQITDDQLDAFLAAHQALGAAAAHREGERTGGVEPLLPVLAAHLGTEPRGLAVHTAELAVLRRVDVDIAVAAVVEAAGGGRLLGIGGGDQRTHQSLSEMLQNAGSWPAHFPVGPVDYHRAATGPDTTRQTVAFGMHLFAVDGVPVALLQRRASMRHQGSPLVEVLCPDEGTATEVLTRVRHEMDARSALRGQVVTFAASPFDPGESGVVHVRRPVVPREDVVLPHGTLDRVERQVLGVAQHRDALRAAGQHLKRGVLLYGPPGTGKTHTVRYLVGASPGTTVILLSGPALQLIGVAAETARALQPSIVVLEDCDLVAEERAMHSSSPVLFEVLDALDGLAADADVTFLLTTNRADVLEPALAQRPGRVDLAVEIPLPDDRARRRLFALYGQGLPFTDAALDAAADATAGMTASFVKEAIRRAVLLAAEAGRAVRDEDLADAVAEMTGDSERITRSLLGVAD